MSKKTEKKTETVIDVESTTDEDDEVGIVKSDDIVVDEDVVDDDPLTDESAILESESEEETPIESTDNPDKDKNVDDAIKTDETNEDEEEADAEDEDSAETETNQDTEDTEDTSESEDIKTETDSDTDSDKNQKEPVGETTEDENEDTDKPINFTMALPESDTEDALEPTEKSSDNKGKELLKKIVGIFKKGMSQTKTKLKSKMDSRKSKKLNAEPKPKKKMGQKWHEFWFGTEEKPVKQDTFKGAIGRWYRRTFCGWVNLVTTMYDKPIDELRCDIELIPRSKIPKEATKVANRKRMYHMDVDLPIRYFDLDKDYGFTASSAYNYARDNSIDEAMTVNIDERQPTDSRKILLIVGIAIAVIIVIYMMMPNMMS